MPLCHPRCAKTPSERFFAADDCEERGRLGSLRSLHVDTGRHVNGLARNVCSVSRTDIYRVLLYGGHLSRFIGALHAYGVCLLSWLESRALIFFFQSRRRQATLLVWANNDNFV